MVVPNLELKSFNNNFFFENEKLCQRSSNESLLYLHNFSKGNLIVKCGKMHFIQIKNCLPLSISLYTVTQNNLTNTFKSNISVSDSFMF